MDGFLIINKQKDWTSHDVVAKLRSITSLRKIGHTGTLDPFATGVLVVGIGKATKLFEFLTGDTKEYLATFKLGATSDTDDKTGTVTISPDAQKIIREDLELAILKFTGKIKQTPPQYSAIKVNGKKMYELARKGETTKVKPRVVEVLEFEVLRYRYPKLKVRLKVSSGTYIRSLARDLGEELGVGGYVEKLERTTVGNWHIDQSVKLKRLNKNNWAKYLQPVEAVLDNFELIKVSSEEANDLRLGKKIEYSHEDSSKKLAVIDPEEKLVAIAEYSDNLLNPRKVF
ncbi:tRNA pseudouridine(55) synthase TruB [Patescibacteria group bacterium]